MTDKTDKAPRASSSVPSSTAVKDPGLAPEGHRKIDWAARHSPVLNAVRDKYLKDGAFEGLGVGVTLPIEAKTPTSPWCWPRREWRWPWRARGRSSCRTTWRRRSPSGV